MTKKALQDLMRRVEDWPPQAQDELSRLADEIEMELRQGPYHATEDELKGIDRGLREAAEGRFAAPEEIEAIFAKYRRV